MKFSILPGKNIDHYLKAAWRDLRDANPELGSPFFCPEFFTAVASARDDVEVAVVEENGKIVAFFPFQRGARNIGTAVGGCLSDYHGLICRPDFSCCPMELLRECKLSAWDFDHLIAGQAFLRPYHRSSATSPQIDLSAGSAAYMAMRRPVRPELVRRLERDLGPLRLIPHNADPKMLEWVIEHKSDQYGRTAVDDIFSQKWVRMAIETLHATSCGGFSGKLSLLYAGDMLIAGHFGIMSKNILHYWFPTYDIAYSKYSPGMMLLLKIVEAAPELGATTIDLGKGSAPYKDKFRNSESIVAEGSVERLSFVTAIRKLRRNLRTLISNSPIEIPVRSLVGYARTYCRT